MSAGLASDFAMLGKSPILKLLQKYSQKGNVQLALRRNQMAYIKRKYTITRYAFSFIKSVTAQLLHSYAHIISVSISVKGETFLHW